MKWWIVGAAALALVLGGGWYWWQHLRDEPEPPPKPYTGAAVVWIADDSARIHSTDGEHPLMHGDDLWKPGGPIKLYGLPGESIAFQLVVTAGAERLDAVRVALNGLEAASTERFVVYELPMKRRSGGKNSDESLGWRAGARPRGPPPGAGLPDALIPVALAPAWANYPMTVEAGHHRVVWIDIVLPETLPADLHRGRIEVTAGDRKLADLAIELEVARVVLPYRALRTMLYFEPEDVEERVGSKLAVTQHQQLIHRHHLDTIFPLRRAEDVKRHGDALKGNLYTDAHGYSGPGTGVGASVVILGAYGILREPDATSLAAARGMLEELAELGIEDKPGERDVVLYTIDKTCDSPRSPAWRRALDESGDPRLRRLRIAHTCSEPPAAQPVDVAIVHSASYRAELVSAAQAAGKHVWVYNGTLPHTGSFATDSWPVSLRANAWIQARFDVERWFYWESTFWNDDNKGGLGPYDPWATAETFHNDDGDHMNGDGVMVYPGRQLSQGWRSLDFEGVLPSIRLKQWRRGIQDAAYLLLARHIDPDRAEAIAQSLVGRTFEAEGEPTWPTSHEPYARARRQLFELIRDRAHP